MSVKHSKDQSVFGIITKIVPRQTSTCEQCNNSFALNQSIQEEKGQQFLFHTTDFSPSLTHSLHFPREIPEEEQVDHQRISDA